MSAAKLDDVAQRAGVSSATVSRYLNRSAIVAAKTGERIRRAIEETGYIPNLVAGSLASSKSRLVAVLIPHLSHSIFDVTIEAMVDELESTGTNVLLALTGLDLDRTDRMVRAAISRRADAIIMTGETHPATVEMLRISETPVIQIWELPSDPIDVAIGFSHRLVGREIARFLSMRGYRHPHLVVAEGSRAQMRRDGMVAEWERLGGRGVTESRVAIPSHFGHARRVFSEIRRLEERPDVVVCGSDLLATGLIVEIQAAGFKVPDDMAVVGFGNSAIAGEMRPTITSIDVDGARIAREAMAVIRRRLAGEPVERQIDVGFRLIARESA